MYDRHLDSFVKTVELGSFTRAANALYISPNAVIKHVNLLERDLGVRLLDRTSHGVSLTSAGEIVYRAAREIIAKSNEALADARRIAGEKPSVIRLASSVLRPTARIRRQWSRIAAEHPMVSLVLVRVEDDVRSHAKLLDELGKSIDVMVNVTPTASSIGAYRIDVREAYSSPASFLIPLGHRLCGAQSVSVSDLEGERLVLVARGFTEASDKIRDDILARGLRIDIADMPPYDLESFNDAALHGAIVLNCEEFGDVHPAFVNVPCGDGYVFPFSLMYGRECNDSVREFVEALAAER